MRPLCHLLCELLELFGDLAPRRLVILVASCILIEREQVSLAWLGRLIGQKGGAIVERGAVSCGCEFLRDSVLYVHHIHHEVVHLLLNCHV